MRFILTYRGPLSASGNRGGRTPEKHALREHFAGQLDDLLRVPPLAGRGYWDGSKPTLDLRAEVGGHWFAPVLHQRLRTLAELHVLMLRAGPPGKALHSGDVDNRLKTLLDALRRPQQLSELPKHAAPCPLERPMPVLLDDDSLVSSVAVETERLLGARDPELVELVVTVNTRLQEVIWGNLFFG